MKKTQTTRGRPPKNPEDRKAKVLGFRIESDDCAILEKAAKLADMKLSEWARDRLMTAARAETEQATHG